MGATLYHITLDVRRFVESATSADYHRMFRDPEGRPLPYIVAHQMLLVELAHGHERLPIGAPCDRFCFKSGCLGHTT